MFECNLLPPQSLTYTSFFFNRSREISSSPKRFCDISCCLQSLVDISNSLTTFVRFPRPEELADIVLVASLAGITGIVLPIIPDELTECVALFLEHTVISCVVSNEQNVINGVF